MFDYDSKISCHVHENNHKMDFGSARVVGHEANFHERLFLEALFSIRDPQSGNDHIAIPGQKFTSLWHTHKSRTTFSKNFMRKTSDIIYEPTEPSQPMMSHFLMSRQAVHLLGHAHITHSSHLFLHYSL